MPRRLAIAAFGLAAMATTVSSTGVDVGQLSASSPAAPWEPTGQVLFHAVNEKGVRSYATVDPSTGEVDQLSNDGVDVPAVSVAAAGDWAAVACDPHTSETSNDFAANTAICRVDLIGGERTVIVDTGDPVQHPRVSPTGELIVFAPGASADHGLKVTASSGGPVESLCVGFCPLFTFSDIAWSPDGTKVAFVASTPGSGGHLPQIYTVTVGDNDYTRLTNSQGVNVDPAWSPDGSRIAFASGRSGDTELWVMDADGDNQQQLTNRDGIDIEPSWSPDGEAIVFTRNIDQGWDLATISSGGGKPTSLTNQTGSEVRPLWLPSAEGSD